MRLPDASRVPRWVWFALALALQLGIIGALVLGQFAVTEKGTPVMLTVGPVDPRSPLRGDYVTLTFPDISTIPADSFIEGTAPKAGQKVTIPVVRQGSVWNYTGYGASTRSPAELRKNGGGVDPEAVLIVGSVAAIDRRNVTVGYGFQQYFVPEGKGNLPFGKRTTARVIVGDDGTGLIRQLYVDGRRWP
jgi:uncharacterized membrane-anchored protein